MSLPEYERPTITSKCPSCGEFVERHVYDVGSGPELACGYCEWCWGAEGQDLKPLDPLRRLLFE